MKKSKVLTSPTRLSDLSYDDFYEDDDYARLKSERIQIQKWRKFKHELSF